MPTELEELVGFITNPNPQIRDVALESLVPYSLDQPSIFKADDLLPVKNLKLLIQDDPKIARHTVTILINLSADDEILQNLAKDSKFVDTVLAYVPNPSEPNADLLSMLLANLVKWDGLKCILDRRQAVPDGLGSDDQVMNQLMDLFVKGSDGTFNKHANFDYLAYVFADLAKHPEVRQYFVKKQEYDDAIPLTKIKVFTEHKSDVRRKGVASTIKNVAFDVHSHPSILAEDEIGILPYVLLPITGNEAYPEEDMMAMLPDLQLLPPDKQRDTDPNIVQTHVETLTLLSSSRQGRELMREVKVYPIIRETHLRVDNEGVREACERLVQVLARDEGEGEGIEADSENGDDERIVEV